MARPRTPTNVLELRGSFRKDPQRGRDREDEPKPTGLIGDCPSSDPMTVEEAWKYIIDCAPLGVLTNRDRPYLEIAARLLSHVRTVGIEHVNGAKLGRLEVMLGKLGMSPADASRVRASALGAAREQEARGGHTPADNPFSRIDRRGRPPAPAADPDSAD